MDPTNWSHHILNSLYTMTAFTRYHAYILDEWIHFSLWIHCREFMRVGSLNSIRSIHSWLWIFTDSLIIMNSHSLNSLHATSSPASYVCWVGRTVCMFSRERERDKILTLQNDEFSQWCYTRCLNSPYRMTKFTIHMVELCCTQLLNSLYRKSPDGTNSQQTCSLLNSL